MNNEQDGLDRLSPLQRATLALKEMRARLDAAEQAKREPIAVIGMGCRFPGGADSPEAFWRLLSEGEDAVREVPADRWDVDAWYDPDPDAPGKIYTRRAALVDGVDRFDARFFNIAPREAVSMDPQHRMLLEVAWEALEHAAIAPDRLVGSRTGVFIGIGANDYSQLGAGDATRIDPYIGTGNSLCFAAGRLSFVFGLQGPCVSIDTACSSSLVAVHLACLHLRNGDCDLALAGGVQLTLSPVGSIFLSRARALAPDGRCKTFDAAADGYVRGEGCGVVALKRLSDAKRDGDLVLAVIRGTASNHDGPSGGLTVPNGMAQQTLIRQALANAGVSPARVGLIEAHGTGTSLGDPIEVEALGAVLGEGRPAGQPFYLGSVKTNIGHLEPAAGIAGLMKAVLALRHRTIPAHLHLQTPNPHIPWDRIPATIPRTTVPWPDGDGPRIAGVSAFGLSGTNAHIVLEEAPAGVGPNEASCSPEAGERPVQLLTLSARGEPALRALAGRMAGWLDAHPNARLADVCHTSHTGRTHFLNRIAVLAGSSAHMCAQLRELEQGGAPAGTCTGVIPARRAPKIAFLFTGQGAQYAHMGRRLYELEPVFRDTIDRCDALLRGTLDLPLRGLLFPEPGAPVLIDETRYTQPALFAMEYALVALWRSWGIEPAALLGHSVGEYVAACVAGVFSVEDGLRLVTERARLMHAAPGQGVMVAVQAPAERLQPLIAPFAHAVSIAAINGPADTVIAGSRDGMDAVVALIEREGLKTRRLTVSHAFHSPMMEPVLEALEQAAARVRFSPPSIRLISNLTGLTAGDAVCSPGYWRRHLREPVRFAAGMTTLQAEGIDLFVEIGPSPVLLASGRRCLPDGYGVWLPSMRKERDDLEQMLGSLGALYVQGARIDWNAVDRGDGPRRVHLPTYPFQRERFWIEGAGSSLSVAATGAARGLERDESSAVEASSGTGSEPARANTGGRPSAASSEAALRRARELARDRHRLRAFIQREVAAVLGFDPAAPIDPQQGFFELGMDSLMAVDLRGRLQQALGLELPATVTFDCPTVDALSGWLARDLLAPVGQTASSRATPPRLDEPIAIIGLSCRLPGGANSPEAYWELLKEGIDAVSEVPPDRWDLDAWHDPDPDADGKMYNRAGGFLRDLEVDGFDAAFFGISPREASSMDPQQRMLLEVTWEALERAGQLVDRLAGTRTGVFIGIASNDYGQLMARSGASASDPYAGTGNTFSVAAGRVSFALGLQGPNLPVDTACSSSLVAVHLACQALRTGEADLAVAGGVNLLLSPEPMVYFSKLRALAPDGRCKTFDSSANGFGRGEGCGVVVLKRLSAARADGDPVLAVIRGSAVNHDGRSSGLTVPNGLSQQAVIRQALAAAGIPATQVTLFEAHGTGTALGDPIEARSLAMVLGPGRSSDHPLYLGSAKSNLGHLEAAAGVAGLIKTVLALRHRKIPPHLHFRTLNPHISFDGLPVVIPTTLTEWATDGFPRVAGISSFGMSGTNAHMVIEEAPEMEAPLEGEGETSLTTGRERSAQSGDQAGAPASPVMLLPLSARSPEALRALAGRWRALLEQPGPTRLADLCYTAAVRRSHHPLRLAVVGDAPDTLVAGLEAFRRGEALDGLSTRLEAAPVDRRLAFVFSGHNTQYPGMALQLMEEEPAFLEALRRCEAALLPHTGASIITQLKAFDAAHLEVATIVQPLIFAVQVALAGLWRSYGIVPDAVVGHSLGEIGAAVVAGALTLEEGARIVTLRSRLMARVAGQGAMLAIRMTEQEALELVREYHPRIEIAGINSPTSIVLTGHPDAITALAAALQSQNLFCRKLKIDVAAHSVQMEPLAAELEALLAGIDPRPADIPFYSTVRDAVCTGTELYAGYWARNLREPVRFARAMERLAADGYSLFLEVSPHPVLVTAMDDTLYPLGIDGRAIPSLHRERAGRAGILSALGTLYTEGYPVEWERMHPGGGRVAQLPDYPWQHRRFWFEEGEATRGTARPTGRRTSSDPLERYYFQTTWEDRLRATGLSDDPGSVGAWLILEDTGGIGRALATRIGAAGGATRFIRAGAPGSPFTAMPDGWQVDPTRADHFDRLLLENGWIDGRPLTGLVHLWPLDADPTPELTVAGLDEAERRIDASLQLLTQAIVRRGSAQPPRIWCVTRGAQPAGTSPHPIALAQSPVWGLGKAITLEHPELWGGLVDLDPARHDAEKDPARHDAEKDPARQAVKPDPARQDAEVEALWLELGAPDGEELIAFREGVRRVARFVHGDPLPGPAEPLRFRSDASWLITGGFGGVGLRMARWMVDRGARHLVMLGRTGLPDRSTWDAIPAGSPQAAVVAAVRDLEASGATVYPMRGDVADPARMAEVFEAMRAFPPLRGVIHAAGTQVPKLVPELTLDDLHRVFRPKVAGGWVLHDLTKELELDCFILFSSLASAIGSGAMMPYCGANQFLDVLAHHRRAVGLPALAVNWGGWAGEGMMTAEAIDYFRQIGVGVLEADVAFEGLSRLMQADVAQRTLSEIDWSRYKPIFETRRRRPLLEKVEAGAPDEVVEAPADRGALRRELEQTLPGERLERLSQRVQAVVAGILGLDPAALDPRQGFFNLGMDSLMSVKVRTRLQGLLEASLPTTLAFEHPTVDALVAFIAREVLKLAPAAPVRATAGAASHGPMPPAGPSARPETAAQSTDGNAPPPAETPGDGDGLEGLSEDDLLSLLEAELDNPASRSR